MRTQTSADIAPAAGGLPRERAGQLIQRRGEAGGARQEATPGPHPSQRFREKRTSLLIKCRTGRGHNNTEMVQRTEHRTGAADERGDTRQTQERDGGDDEMKGSGGQFCDGRDGTLEETHGGREKGTGDTRATPPPRAAACGARSEKDKEAKKSNPCVVRGTRRERGEREIGWAKK